MNKAQMLFLSCLMLATYSFAWTSGYAPASCVGAYSILGSNFAYATENTSTACIESTAWDDPITFNSTAAAAYMTRSPTLTTSNISVVNQVSFSCVGCAGGGAAHNDLRTSGWVAPYGTNTSTGAIWITITNAYTGDNMYLWITNGTNSFTVSRLGSAGAGTTLQNITLGNGWISNGSINLTLPNGLFNYSCADNFSGDSGSFTVLQNCHIAINHYQIGTVASYSSLSRDGYGSVVYASQVPPSSTLLRSDYANGTSAPNTASYSQALLFATGQAGQMVITPRITFIPATGAYANFINTSTATAYMANNTVHYILDTNSNIWFICPAYVFTPGVVATIQCLSTGITGSGTGTTNSSSYQYLFNGISTGLYPITQYIVYSGNNTDITYFVFSSNNSLNYYGMSVAYANITGGGSMVIYSSNVSSSTGGTLQFNVNQIGTYQITTWFNKQGYPTYYPFTQTFYIINNTGLALIPNLLSGPGVISGWAFYFIALVVSMCIMGFMSRYTVDGAGIIAVIVLWGFTLLDPAAVLLPSFPFITTTIATLITTIGVFSAIYIRYSAGTGGG